MRPAYSAAAWAIHYADRAKGAQKDAEAAKAAPTLEHLRAEGVKHAVAHCEADE